MSTIDENTDKASSLALFWRALRERAVPTTVLVYCGGAWGVLEAGQFFIAYYGLSASFLRAIVITVLMGLPVSVVFAWYHGLPGAQEVTRREVTILSTIVFLWLVLLLLPGSDIKPIVSQSHPKELSGLPDKVNKNKIAVLYFQNLSTSSHMNWLAAGLVDTLISKLSDNEKLTVVDRSLVAPYRCMHNVDVRQVATVLGCGQAVTGSYQILGKQIRLTWRLIDVVRGTTAQAVTLDGNLEQIFKLQDELALQVLKAIVGVSSATGLENQENRQVPFSSLDTYKAYCEAIEAIDGQRYSEAMEKMSQALESGMAFSNELLPFLEVSYSRRFIDEQGLVTSESLNSWRNDTNKTVNKRTSTDSQQIIAVRSIDGMPLRVERHESKLDSAFTRTVHFANGVPPGERHICWERRREATKALFYGTSWHYGCPDSSCTLGVKSYRSAEVFILPRGAEPLIIRPEPKNLFFRDGRWRIAFARVMPPSICSKFDIFYTMQESGRKLDELSEFDPSLLYPPIYREAKGLYVADDRGNLRIGDLLTSVNGTIVTTVGQWRSLKKEISSTAVVQIELVRHGTKQNVKFEMSNRNISVINGPYVRLGEHPFGDLLLTRAKVAMSRQQWKRANELLKRALSSELSEEQKVNSLVSLGICATNLSSPEKADSFFEQAVETLDKVEPKLLDSIPQFIFKTSPNELHERLLKNGNDFMASYGLALHSLEVGNFDKAAEHIALASAALPSARWNERLKARLYKERKEYALAADHALAVLRLPIYESRRFLADYLRTFGHHEAAVEQVILLTKEYRPLMNLNAFYEDCVESKDFVGLQKILEAYGHVVFLPEYFVRLTDWYLEKAANTSDESEKKSLLECALSTAEVTSKIFHFRLDICYVYGKALFHNGQFEAAKEVFERLNKYEYWKTKSNDYLLHIAKAKTSN